MGLIMKDNDLKQAIRNAEHPALSADYERRALQKIRLAIGTAPANARFLGGNVLGFTGLTRRSQAVLLALMLFAAAWVVQQQFISHAEEDLMSIDTLSMSTLLAL